MRGAFGPYGPMRVALGALVAVELEQAHHRVADAGGGELHRLAAKGHAVAVDAAAEVELVTRHHAVAHAARGAVEADGGEVVLAAGIGAAAHLDVRAAGQRG